MLCLCEILLRVGPGADAKRLLTNKHQSLSSVIGQREPPDAGSVRIFLGTNIRANQLFNRSGIASYGCSLITIYIVFLRAAPIPVHGVIGFGDGQLHTNARNGCRGISLLAKTAFNLDVSVPNKGVARLIS